jgi:cation transport protein ChaC
MWIFAYGSLMGDGWEERFGCLRRCVAVLHGYGRTFNKASRSNWGSKEVPCPTLNLEKIEDGLCKGIAFEFADIREVEVREYLAVREGKGFPLERMMVRVEDAAEVQAYVPVYRGKNWLPADKVQQRALMVNCAAGKDGSCRDYVKRIAELLTKLGIDDPAVSELWQAVQDESLESIRGEICGRLEILESNLPRRVDGFAVSPHTKIPFKALVYREALIWRMTELGRAAFDCFEKNKLAAGILLTRAAVETSAALWYLSAKLDASVQSGTVGDIDDYLMKLMMGSKSNQDIMPAAINVLTFVDCVDKDIKGFRQQYDGLSEFARPNWRERRFSIRSRSRRTCGRISVRTSRVRARSG